MSFNNQREIYQALCEGKKVVRKDWSRGAYVSFNNLGELVNEEGIEDCYLFNEPFKWSIYEEPKAEEKWYRVTAHYKTSYKPTLHGNLYSSKQDFLVSNKNIESDYHWIHLEEFKREAV